MSHGSASIANDEDKDHEANAYVRSFRIDDPYHAASKWLSSVGCMKLVNGAWRNIPKPLHYLEHDRLLLYAWVNNRREAVNAITDVMAFASLVTRGVFPFPEAFAMSHRATGQVYGNSECHASGYLLWRVPQSFLECVDKFPGLALNTGRGRGTVMSSQLYLEDFGVLVIDPEWCFHRRNRFSCPQPKQTDPTTAGVAMLSCYFKADYGLKRAMLNARCQAAGHKFLNQATWNTPPDKLAAFQELSRRRLNRALQHQHHICNAKVYCQLEMPSYNNRFAQRAPFHETVQDLNVTTRCSRALSVNHLKDAKQKTKEFFAPLLAMGRVEALKRGVDIESGESEADLDSSASEPDQDDNDAVWPALPQMQQPPPQRELVPDRSVPLPPRPALQPSRPQTNTVLDLPCCQFDDDDENENRQVGLQQTSPLSPGFECSHERPCYKYACKACIGRRWTVCCVISDSPKKSAVWFGPDAPMPLSGQCQLAQRWVAA